MADKYSTIQQHQPLRVPISFDKYGRALVLQLDEIFDDIYKRFGRLRIQDMGKAFQQEFSDAEGNITELQTTAQGFEARIKDNEDNITELQVTAEGFETRIESAEGAINELDITADGFEERISNNEGDISTLKTSASGFEASIRSISGDVLSLQGTAQQLSTEISGVSGDVSAIQQQADRIELSVQGKYTKVDGITIDTNGVEISASGTEWDFIKQGLYAILSGNTEFSLGTKALTAGKYGTQIIPGGSNLQFVMRGMNPSTGSLFDSTLYFVIDVPYGWNDTPQLSGTKPILKLLGLQKLGEIGNSVGAIHAKDIYAYTIEPMDTNHDSRNANYQQASHNCGSLGTSLHKWSDIYGQTIHGTLAQSSSHEVKQCIRSMRPMGNRLDQLRPVTFVYKDDPKAKTRYGLIYEETLPEMPEICLENDKGEKSINYVELVPMLLKEVQDLRKRVAELEAIVNV